MNLKSEERSNQNPDLLLKKLDSFYIGQNYKEGYEFLQEALKENSMSIKLLSHKLRFENQLKKFDDCLATCNFLLFLQPNNMEAHQIKLNILKIQQKFNYLSDCLVIAMTLFPNISFT
jgi:tetratricopeptide (TPR) repeat protein